MIKRWKAVFLITAILIILLIVVLYPEERTRQDIGVSDVGIPRELIDWYEANCDYIELDPETRSPRLPDGLYINCRWQDVSDPAHSPYWYATHCDLVDGAYVNCR